MKIKITGWNGFLSQKLRENTELDWSEDDGDVLLHLGGPTFTHSELFEHDAQVMHQYVRETIKIVDRFPGRIIFASTTGVDDIRLDHKGSTSYNLAKLYLENYIINNCEDHLILRIGTVISDKMSDVNLMKPDRIQPRVLQKDLTNIPLEDYYLPIETFVSRTVEAIKLGEQGILEYNLTKLSIWQLVKMFNKE